MNKRSDQAVAAVVGFLLILAAAVTWYSYAARSDTPRRGATNEASWDQNVGQALTALDAAASANIGGRASVSGSVPAAPDASALGISILPATKIPRPQATVGFEPRCGGSGGVTAQHALNGATVQDVVGGANGCLAFASHSVYTPSFGYRAEFGGLVRTQGDRALVVAGPPLRLSNASGTYSVSLTLLDLTGPATSVGLDKSSLPIDLVPKPSTLETPLTNNAASATWVLTTSSPTAWKAWFGQQIAAAGFDPTLNYACTNADAACSGLSAGQVLVSLGGSSSDPNVPDLSYSVSYGRYQVEVGS